MKKNGYALIRLSDNAIVQTWPGMNEDANGRPGLRFPVPGTDLDVNCPTPGDEYGGHKFVLTYFNDPGSPGRWHSFTDSTAFDGVNVVTTRSYSGAPDIVPPSVLMAKARLALLKAGLLQSVNDAIAGLGAGNETLQIMWEYSAEISRGSPELEQIANLLGLSSAQIDDLFRSAA